MCSQSSTFLFIPGFNAQEILGQIDILLMVDLFRHINHIYYFVLISYGGCIRFVIFHYSGLFYKLQHAKFRP